MYPNNERPDRKQPRTQVRPPAAGETTGSLTDEQRFTAPPESVMPDPVTGYPPAVGYAEPAGTSGAGAYGEPASYPTSAAYEQPATTSPTAGTYAAPATPYSTPPSYAEPTTAYPATTDSAYERTAEAERTIELREEQLVARKDLREVGEITVRTVIEEVPGRLEVEAQREEVEIEHVPMGQIVGERVGPYEEDGVLVVPIYEEQLVVVKRLVLKEHLRVRRVASTERQLFEDTLRRDRLVIEDPNNTRLVHEQYATNDEHTDQADAERDESGPLGQLMRKVLG